MKVMDGAEDEDETDVYENEFGTRSYDEHHILVLNPIKTTGQYPTGWFRLKSMTFGQSANI